MGDTGTKTIVYQSSTVQSASKRNLFIRMASIVGSILPWYYPSSSSRFRRLRKSPLGLAKSLETVISKLESLYKHFNPFLYAPWFCLRLTLMDSLCFACDLLTHLARPLIYFYLALAGLPCKTVLTVSIEVSNEHKFWSIAVCGAGSVQWTSKQRSKLSEGISSNKSAAWFL